MGSLERATALERFVKKNKELLIKEYGELLLGKTVIEFLGSVVDYYVGCRL